MAIITPSDVFQPEFIGDTAIEILFSKTDLLTSGFIADARAMGAFADSADDIKFPKYTGMGSDAQDLPEDGSAVTPDEITMGYDSESSIDKIIPYRWTQKALETALRGGQKAPGSVEKMIAMAVAQKSKKAIQASLITCATTAATAASQVYTDPAGTSTYAGLLRTEYGYFGEYAGDGDTLAVMHPNCVYDLLLTPEVQKAQVYGAPPSVVSGKVTMLAGKAILPLSAVPVTAGVYSNLILRRNVLSLYPLRDLTYQEQAIALSDAWNTWFTFRYAAHCAKDLPVGCITYKATSSLDS
jgi:hypothetical protein